MSESSLNSLKNQIWTTRICRVNAEKRLNNKEAFIEGINIYYSCYTVILSIFLLIYSNSLLNYISLVMTITLTISILYFKSLRFSERANNYRRNYTRLQMLELKLDQSLSEAEISDIKKKYCLLLCSNENHITFDYYKTVADSRDMDYKKARWNKEISIKYYWGILWRISIKFICIVFPIIITIIAFWGRDFTV